MTNEIKKLKEDIAILQQKLEAIEKQPKMIFQNEGEFSIVYYDGTIYYRLQFPDGFCDWYRRTMIDRTLSYIDDIKTKNELESRWLINDVKSQNDDEVEQDEKDNSKPMDEVVERLMKKWEENPPSFLRFEFGKTLEDLITRWWCDVFTTHDDWDMETAIDDLCDRIYLWLPKEQNSFGTQSASTIDLVDGYNDALRKIKSKVHSKKV